MKQLRAAVIGAGMMGRFHSRILSELPDVELTAVADVLPEVAQSLANTYGTRSYTDYRVLLDQETVDVAVICTPEHDHLGPVLAAAGRGCHLLVEKPLAASLAETDQMIAACDGAGVQLMVGYVLRFESAYYALQRAIRAGSIGRLVSAYARRNVPIQEARRLKGRTDVVHFIGCHDIDQIVWMHDEPVCKVSARAARGRVQEEFGTPDLVWTTAEFADGFVAVVETGWCLPTGWGGWSGPPGWGGGPDVRLDVIGTAGMLSLDMRGMNLVGIDGRGWMFPDTRHWPEVDGQLAGALRLQDEHFLNCVRTGCPNGVDGNVGRTSLEICLAARRALETGRDVEF